MQTGSELTSRQGMNAAILSACFGAVSQVMVRESSIIILYARKLGAGTFLSIFSTSAQLLAICLFIVPVAYVMEHTGKKKLVLPAILLTMAGILLIASAGFFGSIGNIGNIGNIGSAGSLGRNILLAGLLLFSVSLSVYIAGWFPLLKGVVPDDYGSRFFGRLRMSWQTVVTVFLLLSYFFIGKDASVPVLQAVIGVSGLLILGRYVLVAKIPEAPVNTSVPGFLESLKEVLASRKLILFGGFIFLFSLFSDSVIPVSYVFAKSGLDAPDNYTVLLSFFVNTGSIIGFGLGGFVFHKAGAKPLMLISAGILAGLNMSLLSITEYTPLSAVLCILILTVYTAVIAVVFVSASARMLTLAGGRIINVSLAVCYAFQTAGKGVSRLVSGSLLETGVFPESWNIGRAVFTQFHGFFLFLAVCLLVFLIVSLLITSNRGSIE